MNTRRRLLIAVGAALAAPAFGQDGKPRRIGFLAPLSRSTRARPDAFYDAFVEGMRDAGYVEGKNLVIEWRFADGKFDRLPALAEELARSNVELIVTHSTPAIRALQRATRSIPIVFATAIDPIASGFAASLARPGGNITGLSIIDTDPNPKRVELLKLMVPGLKRLALLVNPATSAHAAVVKSVGAAGEHAGVQVVSVSAADEAAIAQAFVAMRQERASGAIIADDAFFRAQRKRLADLALENRLPAIAPWREYVAAGGLMSYGQDIVASFRRAAAYVDRILKGAKPGDLPIEQPTTLELVVNRRTAKLLGIAIPSDLLLRADQVIG
jgi:putative ABC transport system substrate-binding protein